MNAMEIGPKKVFNLDWAGISLIAYMMKRPTDVKPAYLKIVPYCVAKNPSDPSLMTTAISYIALGPSSFVSISQSITILIPINKIEKDQALNETKVDVELDMRMLKSRIAAGGAANNVYFKTSLFYRPDYR